MITFKEFLFEKKMGGSTYAQVMKRLEEDARIGFEIEVFVPTDTFYHREPDVDPAKKLKLTDINTWNEVQIYFDVSRQQEGAIDGDFESWKVEKEDDWVDQNWEDFVTDEESRTAEKDARRAALKQVTNKYTWEMWFSQEFENIQEFLEKYELEPSHGWADDEHVNQHAPLSSGYYSGFKNTAKAMAEHLGRILKTTVRVNGEGYSTWNITHDTSIKDSEGKSDEEGQGGVGVEIVSPPLAPAKAIEQLKLVLSVLDEYEIETNESTGIHVNISLPNMQHFDPLKLVLFMGDKHILQKFDRMANTFTNSQLQQVIDSISLTGKVPRSADELIKLGREGLKETGKYFSVNLNHLPKYLEFRAAGGANYHRRISDIQEVIGRWLSAVEIAASPDMHRREYLKKVMQLVDKTQDGTDKKELEGLGFAEYLRKKEPMFLDTLDDAKSSDDQSLKIRALRSIMMVMGEKLDSLGPIPFAWLKEVRALFSSMGVSVSDVVSATNSGEALKRVSAALRAFKLLK